MDEILETTNGIINKSDEKQLCIDQMEDVLNLVMRKRLKLLQDIEERKIEGEVRDREAIFSGIDRAVISYARIKEERNKNNVESNQQALALSFLKSITPSGQISAREVKPPVLDESKVEEFTYSQNELKQGVEDLSEK